ncbi:MAG: ABC transporter ATP-binding protein, partial [Chloroflexota bacterium]|nr:ABC transporter ATP-binding protein [Chloroflexota bacterium]
MAEALRLEKLCKHFEGLQVLNDVNLVVERGERRAIIGPNGAGKTTLFNLISGQLEPSAGRVWFEERDVTGQAPHQMWAHGLARTFQKNNLFFQLTTHENVRLAVQRHHQVSHRWFAPAIDFNSVNEHTQEILQQLGLWDRRSELVKNLSYGEQRQLEVAIALAAEPKMLLLDEPTAGMSPAETTNTVNMIGSLPRSLTLLIIEHDMDAIFALA